MPAFVNEEVADMNVTIVDFTFGYKLPIGLPNPFRRDDDPGRPLRIVAEENIDECA